MTGISFECNQCGACCTWSGYVYLQKDDITSIAEYLHLDEVEFINRFTMLAPNRHQLCIKMNTQDPCPFLKGRRCAIYEVRPKQCRSFPETWGACSQAEKERCGN